MTRKEMGYREREVFECCLSCSHRGYSKSYGTSFCFLMDNPKEWGCDNAVKPTAICEKYEEMDHRC